jgi:hypothetical protein
MVILRRKWLREVLIDWRAISLNQETFFHPTVARGQIVEQPANQYDGVRPRFARQWRLVFVQAAEPSEHVGIPT